MEELKLIGKKFEDYDIPTEQKYLNKYFCSVREQVFLKYYCCFGNVDYIIDHTGVIFNKYWLKILTKRFHAIEKAHKKAKQEFDLDLYERIEAGDCTLAELNTK